MMRDKRWPRPNDIVTVVDNETGEEATGRIKVFQPNYLVLAIGEKRIVFNAKKVHFKEYI